MKYKSINIIGSWFSGDGYSSHTKQLAVALEEQGIEVSVTCNKPSDWAKGLNDKEFKMLQRNSENAEVNLFIGLPHFWPLFMCENKPFIGFFVFEGDRIPENWISIMLEHRVKQIWVPSIHVEQAIQNTAVDVLPERFGEVLRKIQLVPHGVDLSLFHPLTPHTTDKLTFICNGGWPKSWNDRKGLSYAAKAYLEEFTSKDDIAMFIKVNMSYGLNIDKNISDLDIQNKDTPKLNFLASSVPYEQLNEFYNKGNVFLNTSLADGFNLTCLEAMACGLPVITTTFGGMTDFVNEDNGWYLKEGVFKEVFFDIMYEGIKWKKPCVEEIKRELRRIYTEWIDDKNIIQQKGIKALESAKAYTWIETAKKAISALSQLD